MIGEIIAKKRAELSGWNNGFCDGYIVGEDKDFLFYVIPGKEFPAEDVVEVKDRCSWDTV